MSITTYPEFVELVNQYKIFPFSDFIPDCPSLTSLAVPDNWHTDTEFDPWLWRIKIVKEEHAAYGKFFGTKGCFISIDWYPRLRLLLSQGKSVEERYSGGLLSPHARNVYQIVQQVGHIDARNLRKESGLTAKEQKKDYDRALVELQNFGDIVITGAQESSFEGGWSSMCYESSEYWLQTTLNKNMNPAKDLAEAKEFVKTELPEIFSEKGMKYLDKKLHLGL